MNKILLSIIWVTSYIVHLQANNDLHEDFMKKLKLSNIYPRDVIKIYPSEKQLHFSFSANITKLMKYKIWNAYSPSIGLPFPNVNIFYISKRYFTLSPKIQFILKNEECDIPKAAIYRYYNRIIIDKLITHATSSELDQSFSICSRYDDCEVMKIEAEIDNCKYGEMPSEEMNEKYKISIRKKGIKISAGESWGILRGLETLAQMAIYLIDYKSIIIQESSISDGPKRKYRGLMIDTGRHFIGINKIIENLDAMEMNKMNVFHWHLTDDQSFPFKSSSHPNIAINGAYDETLIYNSKDIRAIVEYARLRAIRVIPEVDIPNHIFSMFKTYPNLAFHCQDNKHSRWESMSSVNMFMEEMFDLLWDLYLDLFQLFPDDYVHLGFDEIEVECLKYDNYVQKYMKEKKLVSFHRIVELFLIKLQTHIKLNMPRKKMIIWQDAYIHYKNALASDTTVEIYMYLRQDSDQIFSSKFPIILSQDYYLDQQITGLNWYIYYQSEYLKHNYKNLIGGEACMWTEFHSSETITNIIWPVTSGLAEILWTKKAAKIEDAGMRIEEHRCRMLRRGISVGVAGGPGSCKYLEEHVSNISVSSLKIPIYQNYVNSNVLSPSVVFLIGVTIGFYSSKILVFVNLIGIFTLILMLSKLKELLFIVYYP